MQLECMSPSQEIFPKMSLGLVEYKAALGKYVKDLNEGVKTGIPEWSMDIAQIQIEHPDFITVISVPSHPLLHFHG